MSAAFLAGVVSIVALSLIVQRIRFRRRVNEFAKLAGVTRCERESDASLLNRAANRFRILGDRRG